MTVNSVVLRDTRDEGGTRYLDASIKSNGDLVFSGQDFGPGVEAFWGVSEYEWVWTVAACDCKQLLVAFGGEYGHVIGTDREVFRRTRQ